MSQDRFTSGITEVHKNLSGFENGLASHLQVDQILSMTAGRGIKKHVPIQHSRAGLWSERV